MYQEQNSTVYGPATLTDYLYSINFPNDPVEIEAALKDPNSSFYKMVQQLQQEARDREYIIMKIIEEFVRINVKMSEQEKEAIVAKQAESYLKGQAQFEAQIEKLKPLFEPDSKPQSIKELIAESQRRTELIEEAISEINKEIEEIDERIEQHIREYERVQAEEADAVATVILDPDLEIVDDENVPIGVEEREQFVRDFEEAQENRDIARTMEVVAQSEHQHHIATGEEPPDASVREKFIYKENLLNAFDIIFKNLPSSEHEKVDATSKVNDIFAAIKRNAPLFDIQNKTSKDFEERKVIIGEKTLQDVKERIDKKIIVQGLKSMLKNEVEYANEDKKISKSSPPELSHKKKNDPVISSTRPTKKRNANYNNDVFFKEDEPKKKPRP